MKIKCTNAITSTDKKVVSPFVKGKLYDAVPLVINGKTIPNEFLIEGAERPHKHVTGWIALTSWPRGLTILGIATFEEVKTDA